VSVVVCTRDRPALLPGSVESIAAALGPRDLLVVVEDGDSGAAAALAGLGPRGVHLSRPAGAKSPNMNAGLAVADREIVLYTDDDCRVPEGWVDAMARAFVDDPRTGIAFGPVRGLTGAEGHLRLPPGPAPQELWIYSHGASMAVRRAAVLDVGGWDERLGPGAPAHGEEGDMVLRMRSAGWACVIADAPIVEHVEWRDDEESTSNVIRYQRGAGAYLGAGLRRDPRPTAKSLALRLLFEWHMWSPRARWRLAPRALAVFAGGLLYGLRLRPRRWL
jgi:GT2 family glycosyltransferase